MKISVDTVLVDFDGENLKLGADMAGMERVVNQAIQLIPNVEDKLRIVKMSDEILKPMTLRGLIVRLASQGYQQMSADDAVGLFAIVVKLPKTGYIELEAEEQALVKKSIREVWKNVPVVLGQALALLEGKNPFSIEEKKDEKKDEKRVKEKV